VEVMTYNILDWIVR